MKDRFLKNSAFSFIGQVVGVICGLGTSVVLARSLGPDLRGVLALVILLPATLTALFAMGFTSTVVYCVASKEWAEHEIIPKMLGLFCYLMVLMVPGAGILLYFRESLFEGAPLVLLCVGLVLTPFQVVTQCLACVLVGKHAFGRGMMVKVITGPLTLVVTFLLVYYSTAKLEAAVAAQIVTALLAALVGAGYVLKQLGREKFFRKPTLKWSELRKGTSFGWKAQLGGVSRFLNYRVDQFLVNAFLGNSNLGIYSVAVRNAERLWLLVNSFASVLFPMASEQQEDSTEVAKFTARLGAMVLVLLTAVGVVIGFLAIPMTVFLYGESFRAGGEVIIWLLPGIVALGYGKIFTSFIAGQGRPGLTAIGSLGGLVINVIANILLIPEYGLIGAAMATSISYSSIVVFAYVSFLRMASVPCLMGVVPSGKDLLMVAGRLRNLLRSVLRGLSRR